MVYTVGLIGLGRIGLSFELDSLRVKPASHIGALKLLKDKVKLVAICDLDLKKCEEADHYYSGKEDGVTIYTTSHHFVEYVRNIDIFVVATGARTQPNIISSLLPLQPKLIFAEKPLAENSNTARNIVMEAEMHGVSLCVNHTRRWEQSWIDAVATVKSGEYGVPKKLVAEYSGDPWRVGVHMADLVNWFNPESHSVSRLDVPYLAFNLVVFMEKAALAVGFNGLTVNLLTPHDSPRYSGVKELFSTRGRDYGVKSNTPLLRAYENIIDHLESGKPLACTGEDGVKAIRTVEDWTKEK